MPSDQVEPLHASVRKHVGTVHISAELSLVERKLVNVLLLNAYDNLRTQRRHKIPATVLYPMIGWDESKNKGTIKKALKQLMTTVVDFDVLNPSRDPEWEGSTLVASAGIAGGWITYEYSEWLSEKLSNPDVYAVIDLSVQREFSSQYALSLYENCVRFKRVGSTGSIPVETWRKLLGAEAKMYNEFRHFSNHVLKKAIKEINHVSDIVIEPQYERKDRRVTHIRFLVSANPQRNMYELEDRDNSKEIRESETFKGLVALGVGARLAETWVQTEPERAAATLAYVQKQTARKTMENAVGYAIAVFQNGNEIVLGNDTPAKTAQASAAATAAREAEQAQQARAEARAKRTSEAIAVLSIEQITSYVQDFQADGGKVSSYNPTTGKFKGAIERTAFTAYIRGRVGQLVNGSA